MSWTSVCLVCWYCWRRSVEQSDRTDCDSFFVCFPISDIYLLCADGSNNHHSQTKSIFTCFSCTHSTSYHDDVDTHGHRKTRQGNRRRVRVLMLLLLLMLAVVSLRNILVHWSSECRRWALNLVSMAHWQTRDSSCQSNQMMGFSYCHYEFDAVNSVPCSTCIDHK